MPKELFVSLKEFIQRIFFNSILFVREGGMIILYPSFFISSKMPLKIMENVFPQLTIVEFVGGAGYR